jgi:hypothetical protein
MNFYSWFPVEGNDPDCQHDNAEKTHVHGRGRDAVYEWNCPDCGYAETEGYEGDE